ncbi:hypothetical protein [Salipiger bermudensis]|uniref:hypothetical protein n=1 Tax=Salipiger bermudensis TaxID=344736 RepID=UPI001CD32A71|nr:hypothetical protein [Salipiger bermudensis]MCA1288394.1 hypothetical protein [Salipiger bermudensis]
MKKFEYDILFCKVKKQKDYEEMRRALNERGAEGWEVISAEAGDYGYTAFLKREVMDRPAVSVT